MRIPFEYRSLQSRQLEALQHVRRDAPDGSGHDAPPPKRFAEPVAEVAASKLDADTARRLAVDLDCPVRGLGHRFEHAEPLLGMRVRVRVGKPVLEIPPDVAVVREAHERRLVGTRPVAHHAPSAFEFHAAVQR